MHAAICDDNSAELQNLKLKTESYLCGVKNLRCAVLTFDNINELFNALSKSAFDFVELDIELGNHQNGIEAAQRINNLYPDIQIIFVTSYPKFYLDVYNAEHTYFVEKNMIDDLLPKALQKVLYKKEKMKAEDTILVRCKGNQYLIEKHNILYVEKKLRMVKFNLLYKEPIEIYMNIDELLHLLGNQNFVQVHRAFVINVRHVIKLSCGSVVLSDGTNIPLGSTFLRDFQEKLIASHQESR